MKARLIGFLLVIAGLILLTIIINPKPNQTERTLTLTTPDLSNHPIYSKYDFSRENNIINVGIQPLWLPTGAIAEAMERDAVLKKALSEQGMEIRFHPFLKGADVNFYLRRGDLDVAIGGDMPALTAAADSKVVVAALIQQGFSATVANKHMPMSELRGKRIGYAFGSNAHYALLQALLAVDLQETDVRLIPLDVNEMPDALNKGEIDAFSAWEPTPTIAVTQFEDQVVIHRSLTSGYLYFSSSFADGNPEAVRQIVASELRTLKWMRSQDQNLLDASHWALLAGQELSGQKIVLSAEQYAALTKNDLLGTSPIANIPERNLAPGGSLFQEFQFLKRLGKIPNTVKWEAVKASFDLTIIDHVLSGTRKYQLETFEYN